MFTKRFLLIFIFLMSLSLLSVKAHWIADPGPNLITGKRSNLKTKNGTIGDTEWKWWGIWNIMNDSQGNPSLEVKIKHTKELDYEEKKAEGTAYCKAWSAATVSIGIAKGEYDVHAQARGRWWYTGDREKNKHFGGGTWVAEKDAHRNRWFKIPTYSGVHLKGKSYVTNQGAGLTVEMDWK